MKVKKRGFFYKAWVRFLIWFGNVKLWKGERLDLEQIKRAKEVIQDGDIVCRKYNHYLDSYFIPGQYTHSGVYVGDGMIRHLVAEGTKTDKLDDFLATVSSFIILRPYYDDPMAKEAGMNAAKNMNVKYDFLFDTKVINADGVLLADYECAEYYCHEFTALYLFLCNSSEEVRRLFRRGRPIIADDLILVTDVIMKYEAKT